MKRLVLALSLLAVPALAQDAPIETVTSSAGALVGVWKITWPLSPPLPRGLGPEAVMYCRVELARTAPSLNCFDRRNGVLTVSDRNIRIVWSPPMTPQSNVIEAEMTSPDSFSGSERVRMAGITIIRSGGLTGVRQQINPQTPDIAGNAPKLRLVLEEISRGVPDRSYEKAPLVELPDAKTLQGLGPVRSIIYQAKTNVWRDGAWIVGFFSVYLVEFQNGNRLCGLHQREDGVLDGFRCV